MLVREKILDIKHLIVYCKADASYTNIYLIDRKLPYVVSKNIKWVENVLDKVLFIRCHNSFIVNRNFVKIVKVDERVVEMSNKVKVKISRRRLSMFI